VARRVEDSTNETGLGVLVITHFSRLLEVLQPDRVHVLSHGRIHASGGPELAERLEAEGYVGILGEAADAPEVAVELSPGPDPFADPLA
jgi:Fe-S cluster assembly ATP-binding protein